MRLRGNVRQPRQKSFLLRGDDLEKQKLLLDSVEIYSGFNQHIVPRNGRWSV